MLTVGGNLRALRETKGFAEDSSLTLEVGTGLWMTSAREAGRLYKGVGDGTERFVRARHKGNDAGARARSTIKKRGGGGGGGDRSNTAVDRGSQNIADCLASFRFGYRTKVML